jgi:hypothetical protein
VIKQGRHAGRTVEAKRRQKDRDARWTLKRGHAELKPQAGDGATRMPVEIAVPVFGRKLHLNIEGRHGLIRGWTVTDVAAHYSRSLPTCSTRRTRPARCGRTRRIAPGATRRRCSGAD